MTDLAVPTEAPRAPVQYVTDPTGGRLVAWADSLTAAHRIAQALCRTTFVPKHFAGKPEDAAAAILFGDEIGLTPTQALRSIHVISGTPGLYARTMVALVQSRGHEVWTEVDTPSKVVVCGRRKGATHVERSEWTTDRARKAGYTSNKKYETDPQAMLYARAASDVCRKIAADALAGLAFTLEELELSEPGETTTVSRQPAKRVQRKQAAPVPVPDEPDLDDEPAPAPAVEPISDAQMRKLHATFNERGIVERDDRLAFAAGVVGREVGSSKDLSRDEAGRVIDALESLPASEPEGWEPTDA